MAGTSGSLLFEDDKDSGAVLGGAALLPEASYCDDRPPFSGANDSPR